MAMDCLVVFGVVIYWVCALFLMVNVYSYGLMLWLWVNAMVNVQCYSGVGVGVLR